MRGHPCPVQALCAPWASPARTLCVPCVHPVPWASPACTLPAPCVPCASPAWLLCKPCALGIPCLHSSCTLRAPRACPACPPRCSRAGGAGSGIPPHLCSPCSESRSLGQLGRSRGSTLTPRSVGSSPGLGFTRPWCPAGAHRCPAASAPQRWWRGRRGVTGGISGGKRGRGAGGLAAGRGLGGEAGQHG